MKIRFTICAEIAGRLLLLLIGLILSAPAFILQVLSFMGERISSFYLSLLQHFVTTTKTRLTLFDQQLSNK